ncbi:phospholipase A2-like [Anabrus simplex]|uniref:phospholipase A2-like n=1 Tax=Anabrus simplex TaxID=316456 RepID=UPI0035A2841D
MKVSAKERQGPEGRENARRPRLSEQGRSVRIDESEEPATSKWEQCQDSPKTAGTKWCGSGNISESYDDLGVNRETDACCREHDYCPDLIEAGGTGHGLTNGALYTRLNCECDQKFYDCLMKVGDLSSKQVGVTYFDVLNTQCFREDYPIRSCKRYSPIVRKRCLEYEFDEESPKQWQWFDVPFF